MKQYSQLKESLLGSKNTEIDDIIKQAYLDMSKEKIATIINETKQVKVTDTLIEAFLDVAASKTFTLDETILQIRKTNKIDNHLSFVLDDGSSIVISESFLQKAKPYLTTETVAFMRTSKENFNKIAKVITNV